MPQLPENFSYSEDHEWINVPADEAEGKTVRVGITHIAANRLGEIVFAELPEVGDEVEADSPVGELESTKSVSDIISPVSGKVTAINEDLDDDYSVISEDPYEKGWLFEVEATGTADLSTAEEYAKENGDD